MAFVIKFTSGIPKLSILDTAGKWVVSQKEWKLEKKTDTLWL
jgi:hypothetical protein